MQQLKLQNWLKRDCTKPRKTRCLSMIRKKIAIRLFERALILYDLIQQKNEQLKIKTRLKLKTKFEKQEKLLRKIRKTMSQKHAKTIMQHE